MTAVKEGIHSTATRVSLGSESILLKLCATETLMSLRRSKVNICESRSPEKAGMNHADLQQEVDDRSRHPNVRMSDRFSCHDNWRHTNINFKLS